MRDVKIIPVKTSVLGTPFDPPPTAEELAEWKKQWEREYPQRIVDNLTPRQVKDFRKLLKVSQNRQLEKQLASGRSQGAAKNKDWADKRKNYLRKLCAERCAQFPQIYLITKQLEL